MAERIHTGDRELDSAVNDIQERREDVVGLQEVRDRLDAVIGRKRAEIEARSALAIGWSEGDINRFYAGEVLDFAVSSNSNPVWLGELVAKAIDDVTRFGFVEHPTPPDDNDIEGWYRYGILMLCLDGGPDDENLKASVDAFVKLEVGQETVDKQAMMLRNDERSINFYKFLQQFAPHLREIRRSSFVHPRD